MIPSALPCPACGSIDTRYERNDFNIQCVCPHCMMRGPVSNMARRDRQTDMHFKQALDAWNRLPRRTETSIVGRCGDACWSVDEHGIFGCDERMFKALGEPPIMHKRCVNCGCSEECDAKPACTFEYIVEFEALLAWCDDVDTSPSKRDSCD